MKRCLEWVKACQPQFLAWWLIATLGCSAEAPSFELVRPEAGASSDRWSEAGLVLLRDQVRLQTQQLRQIADDLERRLRVNHRMDGTLLLKIEQQISRSTASCERIEALLDRAESAPR